MSDASGLVLRTPVGVARSFLRADAVGVLQGLARLPASLARIPAIIDGVEVLLANAGALVTQVAGTVQRADRLVGGVEATTGRVDAVVDDVAGDIGGLLRESDAIRAAVAALVADLTPLLTAASRISPTAPASLERTLDALPLVLGRLETEVIPAVRSLEGLVPTIEGLSARVDELHRVVGDVGDTLGGIPGAARLRKRSARTPEPTGA